ncbi:MAG: hypothetical protein RL011_748, partial [Pseudomonadota bacterium]
MAQRRSTSRRTARWLIAAWLGSFYLAAPRAYSFPYELSFAHRLTDGKGVPLEGPIDVRIDFYTDEIGDSRIDISPINQGQVTLNDGVFQLSLTLTPPEFHRVFAVNSSAVFIQITDVTHSKTYQRQQFTATPYALKVPIDEKALSYNSDGQLTLGTSAARPTSGQVLSPDSTGKLVWTNFSTLSSQSMTAVPPSEGQVLTYTGGSWVPQSLSGSLPVQSGVTAGTYSKANVTVNSEGIITSVGNGSSVNLDTETTGVLPASRGGTGLASTATFPSSGTIVTRDAAETLQNKTFNETRIEGDLLIKGNGSAAQLLKFFDATNSNYVALRSPAIVSHFQAYTLPASDGLTGSLLTTDGSGQWSWVSGATPTGNATGDLTGSFPNPTLTATGVTAGTYSRVVVDSKGRVNTGLALSVADIPSLPTSILGSGTIPVERGGTGGSSFTANGVLIGAGPNALTSTNAGQSDQILTVDSTGAPAFGAVNLSSANAITGLLPKANGGLGFDTSSLTVPTNGTLITSGGIATLSNKTLSSPLIQEGTVSNAIVTTNRPMSVASDSGLTLLPYDTTNGGTTELRFGSTIPVGNYLGFKAPANVSTNRVWTLPPSDGSANWVLTTNGSGSLSWTSKSSTDLGGDSFDQTNKAAGKVIKWDGSKYYLADDIVGATGSSGIQTLNGL